MGLGLELRMRLLLELMMWDRFRVINVNNGLIFKVKFTVTVKNGVRIIAIYKVKFRVRVTVKDVDKVSVIFKVKFRVRIRVKIGVSYI